MIMMLFLLLAQTKLSASIEILIMLVVAAIIGFVTAWLYYKSICARKLAALEKQLADKERERKKYLRDNDNLKMELMALKKSQNELNREDQDLKAEMKNLKDELSEKDVVLTRIAQKKHLLNYESFGKADKEKKDDLKIISGIGPFIEERLNALDIYTFEQISKFSPTDIETVTEAIEFFPGRIARDHWVDQAKKLVQGREL